MSGCRINGDVRDANYLVVKLLENVPDRPLLLCSGATECHGGPPSVLGLGLAQSRGRVGMVHVTLGTPLAQARGKL